MSNLCVFCDISTKVSTSKFQDTAILSAQDVDNIAEPLAQQEGDGQEGVVGTR